MLNINVYESIDDMLRQARSHIYAVYAVWSMSAVWYIQSTVLKHVFE